MKQELPEHMSIWLHTSGERYRVILVANEGSDRPGEYPITIVYRRLSDNTVWSRPFSRWYPSFTEIEI